MESFESSLSSINSRCVVFGSVEKKNAFITSLLWPGLPQRSSFDSSINFMKCSRLKTIVADIYRMSSRCTLQHERWATKEHREFDWLNKFWHSITWKKYCHISFYDFQDFVGANLTRKTMTLTRAFIFNPKLLHALCIEVINKLEIVDRLKFCSSPYYQITNM